MDEGAENQRSPAERLVSNIESRVPNVVCECVQCAVDAICSCDSSFLHTSLIPAVETISQHPNIHVINYLMESLPELGENLFEFFPDDAETILLQKIFPIIHRVISIVDDNLVDSAADCFASLVTIIDTPDFIHVELPQLIHFSQSQNTCARNVVCLILSLLTEFFDENAWLPELLDLLGRLTCDAESSVRANVPDLVAGYIARVTHSKDRAQLCAWFSILCRDSSVEVRTAAANAILEVTEAMDVTHRYPNIFPLLSVLLNDSSEDVRNAVRLTLGKLISLIGKGCDGVVVGKYCSCLTSEDCDIAYASAFALPGVAHSLGSERWCELRFAFLTACESIEVKVRRTLAFGLSSYAFMIDPDGLQAITLQFLKDIPDVAVGVLSELRVILKHVRDVRSLQFCLEDPRVYHKWRARLYVSRQLRECADVFDRVVLIESVKNLLRDEVYVVRQDACLSFAALMTEKDLEFVKIMSRSSYFVDRLTSANLIKCAGVLSFLDIVTALSHDPVPNVRLAIARVVNCLEEESVSEIKRALSKDSDPDVRSAITDAL